MFRTLVSQLSSILLALVLAVVIWAVATNEQNPSRDGLYQEPISLEFTNKSENLVVYQKTADSVRLRLLAPEASWQNLRTTNFRATIDLAGRAAGVYHLPVKIESTDPTVQVSGSTPTEVTVRLERLTLTTFPVRVQLANDPAVGYEYHTPVVLPSNVSVSGPQALVSQAVSAVAIVDVRGAKAQVEREVALSIQDEQGATLTGLAAVPPTVTVQIPVVQRLGYKEVAIRPVLKGTVASGYWISNVNVTPSTATLVGSPEALAHVAGFVETQPVDVSDQAGFVIQRGTLVLATGVSLLRDNTDITVQVSIDPVLAGQTIRRKIRVVNLKREMVVSVSPDSVDLILSGPLPTLQALTPNDVTVVLDGSNLDAGTYQLQPSVQLIPSALKVESIVPGTVEVIVTRP